MTDQDPFARTSASDEPAHSAGPDPSDGSATGGVRYDHPSSSSSGHGSGPGSTATMPRTDTPTGWPATWT